MYMKLSHDLEQEWFLEESSDFPGFKSLLLMFLVQSKGDRAEMVERREEEVVLAK